jgi:hypothetical protein
MNNTTTTKRNLAITAIFMAATLVIGTFVTTTTVATTAFAYSKKGADKKDGGNGNDNGNTITIQKCKQSATQSGFDNNQGQECENVICTHPGENATCVQEGLAAAVQQGNQTTPVTLTCQECLTKFLNAEQILLVTRGTNTCAFASEITTEQFQLILLRLADITGQPIDVEGLIQCLIDAGVHFSTGRG